MKELTEVFEASPDILALITAFLGGAAAEPTGRPRGLLLACSRIARIAHSVRFWRSALQQAGLVAPPGVDRPSALALAFTSLFPTWLGPSDIFAVDGNCCECLPEYYGKFFAIWTDSVFYGQAYWVVKWEDIGPISDVMVGVTSPQLFRMDAQMSLEHFMFLSSNPSYDNTLSADIYPGREIGVLVDLTEGFVRFFYDGETHEFRRPTTETQPPEDRGVWLGSLPLCPAVMANRGCDRVRIERRPLPA
eukprot:TRINITY_DN57638_c0_g1_i1.p1 TRINITY_DN57638_c0_g1~~TRINITY_DN57638_c0_g1_i1.p1  ORF type:complete len:248 (-),score=31.16 TRINITY_DN57638_c0_g1_i1:62-805(-)